MNRTLNSCKTIKLNSIANRFVAEQNKKKYAIYNKKQYKQIIIRKYSTNYNCNLSIPLFKHDNYYDSNCLFMISLYIKNKILIKLLHIYYSKYHPHLLVHPHLRVVLYFHLISL